jgi:hypothetical protein
MEEPSLLHLSGVAFLSVLVLLSILSLLMEGLVRLFPPPPTVAAPSSRGSVEPIPRGSTPDPAEFAALNAALQLHFPHGTVTRIRVTEDL